MLFVLQRVIESVFMPTFDSKRKGLRYDRIQVSYLLKTREETQAYLKASR